MLRTLRRPARSITVYLGHTLRPLRPARPFTSTTPRSHPRTFTDPQNSVDLIKWDFRTKLFTGAVVLGFGYYLYHLEQVPETGRWRFMDMNPALEERLTKATRQEYASEYGDRILPQNHVLTRHVRRVVSQLLEANDLGTVTSDDHAVLSPPDDATEVFWGVEKPGSSGAEQRGVREWTVYVVDDQRTLNAFTLFGTIVVFTGILPFCKDEHGLAAVLSHEIGHVVARHAVEKYSSNKVLIALALIIEHYLGIDFGLGKNLTTLLYSLPADRRAELEDQIGMKIASKACFDPEAAVQVQERLAALGLRRVDFFDTHPRDAKRLQALRDLLPHAYALRAQSPACAGLDDRVHAFKTAADALMSSTMTEDEGVPIEETWL